MTYYMIISGPLGVGKSTIARSLAKTLDAEYISVDRILDEHDLTKDKSPGGFVSERSFLKVNEIVAPRALEILQNGGVIVFDGNFYRKSQIENLISKLDFDHYVFTLKAPLETCIRRDRERDKTHGEDAACAVYKISTSFEFGISIDTEHKDADQIVEEILSHLPKKG